MRRILFISIIMLILIIPLFAKVEIDSGLLFEYDAVGFKYGFNSGASFGLDLGIKYRFLYADATVAYKLTKDMPLKSRISVGMAFDLWKHLRLSMCIGNDFDLVRNDETIVTAWSNGMTDGNPFNTPLFIRLETAFLTEKIKLGLVANFATPMIVSKNNLPDLFKAYRDENLRNTYLFMSSLALSVQWRF